MLKNQWTKDDVRVDNKHMKQYSTPLFIKSQLSYNHSEIEFHIYKNCCNKKRQIIESIGEDWSPHTLLVGMWYYGTSLKNTLAVFQKT